MTSEHPEYSKETFSGWWRAGGYAVHVYTALGAACGLFAAEAILRRENRLAFIWFTIAVLIDASDGMLARKLRVKTVLPHLDGTKLDDIVDYLNYTFLPILMMVQSNWLPRPEMVWASIPLVASLFAFIHCGAKEAGFFRGFPSYWNIVAFYVGIWLHHYGTSVVLAIVLLLSVLSVMPVRFIYPNRSQRYPKLFVAGGVAWLAVIAVILFRYYPDPPKWLIGVSLIYPVFYFIMSVYLDLEARRRSETFG